MIRRLSLFLGAAVVALSLGTGCIGQFALTEELRAWNTEVVSDPWPREGIFLGMYIVPVYPFAFFGDILFINSIEFWTGTNPLSNEPSVAGSGSAPPPVE